MISPNRLVKSTTDSYRVSNTQLMMRIPSKSSPVASMNYQEKTITPTWLFLLHATGHIRQVIWFRSPCYASPFNYFWFADWSTAISMCPEQLQNCYGINCSFSCDYWTFWDFS